MKNIAEVASMIGFFSCSYMGWLIFKLKYDLINNPNRGGGVVGFGN